MPITDESIDQLYYQFLVKADYQKGLKTLCEMFNSHAGGIMSIQGDKICMLAGNSLNPESVSNYHNNLNQEDYFFPFIKKDNNDKILMASALVSLPEIEKLDYYQYVDRLSDVYDKMSYHIVTPSEQYAIALYRDKNRQYTKSEYALAQKLQPHIARCFRLLSSSIQNSNELLKKSNLTKKEIEITNLIKVGNDYRKIADALQISQNTLKWHLKNIFQKLEVSNITDLSLMLRN